MFPLVAIPLTEDRKRQCAKVLRDSLRLADLTLDRAALEAERNARQVARQIAGEEGSLTTLYAQPDTFWRWLAISIAQEFGLPKEVRRAGLLRRVVIGHKRQLRLQMAARKDERSA
jgi:hypothetical protein